LPACTAQRGFPRFYENFIVQKNRQRAARAAVVHRLRAMRDYRLRMRDSDGHGKARKTADKKMLVYHSSISFAKVRMRGN